MFRKLLSATKVGQPSHPDKQLLQHQQLQQQSQSNQFQNSNLQNQQLVGGVAGGFSQSLQQQLLQQQIQLRNQFQLNEIKSYGFSQLCCLGHSPSLSLLAVGSKSGLIRVLGGPSIEFTYQLDSGSAIRKLEFIDCRPIAETNVQHQQSHKKQQQQQQQVPVSTEAESPGPKAKLVALTDNGQLHLLELREINEANFADNTTQTTTTTTNSDHNGVTELPSGGQIKQRKSATQLICIGQINYFKCKLDDEDRSKRISTFEVSPDGQLLYVGTEGANVYLIPIGEFKHDEQRQDEQEQKVQLATSDQQSSKANETNDQGDEQISLSNGTVGSAIAADLVEPPAALTDEQPHPFEMIKFEEQVLSSLQQLATQDAAASEPSDQVKSKIPGAIESIKRHPKKNLLLISYHRGLNILWELSQSKVERYFYHDQILESACFADEQGDFFYTSHNDGSYVRWDTRQGSRSAALEENLNQVYGPYPCKPTPKLLACTGLRSVGASSPTSPATSPQTSTPGEKDKDKENHQPNSTTATRDSQLEELVIFNGGMPRATYDDKNPITVVRSEPDGKDSIKMVLDFSSKVLDFVIITRPRATITNHPNAAISSTGSGGGGKKGKHKQQQLLQQQRQQQIAVALAVLAEEEFVVVDLLSNELLEFPLPYLNCMHSSAITCSEHYSGVSEQVYAQLVALNKSQLERNKLSSNQWPLEGGKLVELVDCSNGHDLLLTGHEDGTLNIWDVSNLSTRHLLSLTTAKYFTTNPLDDELSEEQQQQDSASKEQAWPPMKRVGRFDPYSDDTRLALRKLALCPLSGSLVLAGTGGQILVFELRNVVDSAGNALEPTEVSLVSDQRFVWKGHDKLGFRPQAVTAVSGAQSKFDSPAEGEQIGQNSYQLVSYVQLSPPVSPSSLDLRSDWHLFAIGTSYGFLLYDYANKNQVVSKCTLNVQDFSLISGDAPGGGAAMSRKKSFRKSLRESFRRLRRGRSQRFANQNQAAPAKTTGLSRPTTGVRSLQPPSQQQSTGASPEPMGAIRFPAERQVEPKVELSSIVKCISLRSAILSGQQASAQASFKPSLWVGTNSGQVLVYAITLASEQQVSEVTSGADQSTVPSAPKTSARLAKEIQLKHRAPIVAIFTTPEAPAVVEQAQPVERSESKLDLQGLQKSASSDSDGLKSVSNDQQQQATSGDRSQSPVPAAAASVHSKQTAKLDQQARVLICSEEQFKVFNLPNLKPFCKFKLTANEGLRARKVSITHFKRQVPLATATSNFSHKLKSSKSVQSFATQTSRPNSPIQQDSVEQQQQAVSTGGQQQQKPSEHNNNSLNAPNNNAGSSQLMNAKFGAGNGAAPSKSALTASASCNNQLQDASGESSGDCTLSQPMIVYEPYLVCMSNQGDCAIYSVPDLKRQAQIQVCKREDINGINSTMLTNHGEGYYLRSSSQFLRFSISNQQVPRIMASL